MASSEISESDREALGALIARYAGRDSFLAKGIEIGWAAARERYAIKPELTDRSPEPADEREWTVRWEYPVRKHVIVGPVDGRQMEGLIVVPKSRLDAAMAAADERERALRKIRGFAVLAVREGAPLHVAFAREVAAKADRALLVPALSVPVEGEPERPIFFASNNDPVVELRGGAATLTGRRIHFPATIREAASRIDIVLAPADAEMPGETLLLRDVDYLGSGVLRFAEGGTVNAAESDGRTDAERSER